MALPHREDDMQLSFNWCLILEKVRSSMDLHM